ncbi:Immunoglobulin heavy variable 4-59 [Takifugu flavidus]|nr:Immunoglobulin heavy variable 4-59 [Takifugu flavidus]
MFSAALLLLLATGCESLYGFVKPGQRLTITCQVSYSLSSYGTNWIRQPAGKGLEWIGYNCAGCTPYYKASLKNKFSISLETSSNTVTLNGVNVQPEDTAVYYCARYTITQPISGAEQKLLRASTQHHQRGRCHTRNDLSPRHVEVQ